MTEDTALKMTAAGLRQRIVMQELERAQLAEKHKSAANQEFNRWVDDFLHNPVSEEDMKLLEIRIGHAVSEGRTDVMLFKFPSNLCSDSGRAINNNDPSWPDTLPGKSHEVYRFWKDHAQQAGFGLRAMIVDFPDGMPGDVGVFLSWAEK